MEKILVSLDVPILGEKYDIFVPEDIKISSLTEVLAQGVFDVSGGKYAVSGREMLMLLEPELLLDPQKTLGDYDVGDGSPMMMI